jgi:hypothetical protein
MSNVLGISAESWRGPCSLPRLDSAMRRLLSLHREQSTSNIREGYDTSRVAHGFHGVQCSAVRRVQIDRAASKRASQPGPTGLHHSTIHGHVAGEMSRPNAVVIDCQPARLVKRATFSGHVYRITKSLKAIRADNPKYKQGDNRISHALGGGSFTHARFICFRIVVGSIISVFGALRAALATELIAVCECFTTSRAIGGLGDHVPALSLWQHSTPDAHACTGARLAVAACTG